MSPLAISLTIFALVLSSIVLGMFLRRALPQHHLTDDSRDTIKLGVGVIATIGALVLGLLIASAKGTFDTQSGQVKQITAEVILIDNLLAEYGPEALPIRRQMRTVIGPFADRLWQEKEAHDSAPFAAGAGEPIYLAIQALAPRNDLQRSLQARAAQISTELAQTRLALFVGTGNSIPAPFLAVLVFWFVVIFASFSLFTNMNATVFIALCLFAVSASGAIFLVLELGEPFKGLMMIASEPLRNALPPLGS